MIPEILAAIAAKLECTPGQVISYAEYPDLGIVSVIVDQGIKGCPKFDIKMSDLPFPGANVAADEPLADEPPADEPLADEPSADEPPADEPLADELDKMTIAELREMARAAEVKGFTRMRKPALVAALSGNLGGAADEEE